MDLGPSHHERAISRETGFRADAGGHASEAFLFRRTSQTGEPRIEMLDVPSLRPRGARHHEVKRRRQARKRLAGRVARIVHESAITGAMATPGAPAPTATDGAVPAELQHVGWVYSVIGQATPRDGYWTPGKGNPGLIYYPKPGTQTSSWTMNHSFDVYLDNGDGHPQGNRQIVTYALDGQFTPKRPAESFFHMTDDFQVGTNTGYHLEKAWWTGTIGSDVTPDPATSAKLIWQASEPQTPNAETQYTSGQSFEVGFTGSKDGAEVGANYTVSNEKSYSVPDWGVQNQTSGNQLSWLFSSRSPCDPRSGHYDREKCFRSEALSDLGPQQPNDLSLGQAQVHTNGRWITKGLLEDGNGSLNFSVSTPIGLVDTYCDDFQFFVCPRSHRDVDFATTGPPTQRFTLDASIVNPIPIESLTFSPNPADGGELERVTGTVKLEDKAPMDISVVIYSNSKNAVVGGPNGNGSQRTITIPKGGDTAQFTVQTNDNNLAAGAHTTANITAFYADATTEQLRIQRRP